MNPDMNMPPTNPGIPPQPAMPVAPMPPQPQMQQPGSEFQQPAPMQQPAYAPQPQPQGMYDPYAPAPMPAPQPMFTPVSGPMPAQMPPQPMGMPMQPGMMQPSFTPMAASQMPQSGGKKKLFIILGAVFALLVISGIMFVLFLPKGSKIGSLSSDSYEGINYKRPTAWEKDTSESGIIGYHPKQSNGSKSNGKPTYDLKMNITVSKSVFDTAPNDMSASYKSQLQTVIDKDIEQASTDLLPTKSSVGCDETPVFKDKPAKIDVPGTFLSIKYSFTCKTGSGSTATTFYYTVVDVVPNDKNTEYIMDIGAASQSLYDGNLSKINDILSSISF
jgi:hypothetical protein